MYAPVQRHLPCFVGSFTFTHSWLSKMSTTMAYLHDNWGEVYTFAVTNGKYTARPRFGEHDPVGRRSLPMALVGALPVS
jgi:hypothetical protein